MSNSQMSGSKRSGSKMSDSQRRQYLGELRQERAKWGSLDQMDKPLPIGSTVPEKPEMSKLRDVRELSGIRELLARRLSARRLLARRGEEPESPMIESPMIESPMIESPMIDFLKTIRIAFAIVAMALAANIALIIAGVQLRNPGSRLPILIFFSFLCFASLIVVSITHLLIRRRQAK